MIDTMVRSVALLVLGLAVCLALGVQSAMAGAWAREESTFFVSLSYNWPIDSETAEEGTVSAYVEYGLPWRLTAGANLDQRPVGPHSLEIFLRRNFNAPDAVWQVAAEVGYEMALDAEIDELSGRIRYLTEPGQPALALHLGRGFDSRFGSGWIDMRFGANLPTAEDDLLGEIDATLGLNLSGRVFTTVELWHDYDSEGSFTSLVPGLGVRVTDRIAGTLRYIHETNGDAVDSVEIGTWVEF
ncbi:MAG: hypothetical protein AAGB05_08210 [Pseudomonadota bacterium]